MQTGAQCSKTHHAHGQRHFHWWWWASHITSPSPTTTARHGSLSCSNRKRERESSFFNRAVSRSQITPPVCIPLKRDSPNNMKGNTTDLALSQNTCSSQNAPICQRHLHTHIQPLSVWKLTGLFPFEKPGGAHAMHTTKKIGYTGMIVACTIMKQSPRYHQERFCSCSFKKMETHAQQGSSVTADITMFNVFCLALTDAIQLQPQK